MKKHNDKIECKCEAKKRICERIRTHIIVCLIVYNIQQNFSSQFIPFSHTLNISLNKLLSFIIFNSTFVSNFEQYYPAEKLISILFV